MSRDTLLLVEKCSHCFSYYDVDSGERIASIPLGTFPHEFVIDSAARNAYVGHYGVETSGHTGAGTSHLHEQGTAAGQRRIVSAVERDR